MTSRSWRAEAPWTKFHVDEVLQWGHDLAVMERMDGVSEDRIDGIVLQWGHDLAVMERGSR